MGAMVAAKLAAMAPQRVASLSMLSATGGGWQAFPQSWRVLRLGIQARLGGWLSWWGGVGCGWG